MNSFTAHRLCWTPRRNRSYHNKNGRPMDIAEKVDMIEDVLNVSGILVNHGYLDAAHTPSLIADLIDWGAGIGSTDTPDPVATVADKPAKGKRAKATELIEPTPDPSSDDEPDF